MEEQIGDDNRDELNRTDWRGLGLTDPIKKVEVSDSKKCSVRLRLGFRTNGCYSQLF
jgi:hypothetical protein